MRSTVLARADDIVIVIVIDIRIEETDGKRIGIYIVSARRR